jgi:hypothetical protein
MPLPLDATRRHQMEPVRTHFTILRTKYVLLRWTKRVFKINDMIDGIHDKDKPIGEASAALVAFGRQGRGKRGVPTDENMC